MQLSEETLEMALDLYKAGVDQPTHLLIATANNMVATGYMKIPPGRLDATYPSASLEGSMAAALVAAERHETEHETADGIPLLPPDPNLARTPSHEARMKPRTSSRTPTVAGIQWGSKWVDPNNTEPAKPGAERNWSGWAGMVPNQKAIMLMFTGEKGRHSIGVQTVISFIKKHPAKNKGKERKHLKPHYLMNSLSRRGLVTEIATDVWVLSPRGETFVRDFLGVEPTPKHESIQTVA